jgi:D-glycerate 3-kinase
MNFSNSNILPNWIDRTNLTRSQLKEVSPNLERRSHLFIQSYSEIIKTCNLLDVQVNERLLLTFWNLWIPLAIKIASQRKQLARTIIQGILGGQGTGKTTLTRVIKVLLEYLNCSCLCLSIDDLYKTYAERQKLLQQDPRLIKRGPPGTHDVQLGIEIFDKLLNSQSERKISIPRFDKSLYNGEGDRVEPELVPPVHIVLFEGWFVGVRPVEEEVFDRAPEPIISQEDKLFAIDSNNRLKEYLPLWDKLDSLIVFYPKDYRFSKDWRKEAEHKAIAAGKMGMSDREIEEFVEYFWRALHPELFIKPLMRSSLVDLVIKLDRDRAISPVNFSRARQSTNF